MHPLAELDQLNLEPAAKNQVAAMLQALLDQTARDANLIQAKDIKIAALTHELAYYKRIRFSTKSEALAPLQRDVFEETWNTDISANEAEVEQLQDDQPCDTVVRPKRARAGRQPLPPHLPRIEHRYEPGVLHLRSMRPEFDQDRRRRQRATGRRAGQVFRASPYPPAIRLPALRNHHGGAGFAAVCALPRGQPLAHKRRSA